MLDQVWHLVLISDHVLLNLFQVQFELLGDGVMRGLVVLLTRLTSQQQRRLGGERTERNGMSRVFERSAPAPSSPDSHKLLIPDCTRRSEENNLKYIQHFVLKTNK